MLSAVRCIVVMAIVVASVLSACAAIAASTTNYLLEAADGGAKSRLSWTFADGWLSPSGVQTRAFGYLGTFGAGAIDPTFVSGTFAVSGAGWYNNITTGSSFQITSLGLTTNNNSDLRIMLMQTQSAFVSGSGQFVSYTPGTDSFVVDIPFSKFVPGVYSIDNGVSIPPTPQTLTITAVPEPWTWVMATGGFAYAAFEMSRRRKRAYANKPTRGSIAVRFASQRRHGTIGLAILVACYSAIMGPARVSRAATIAY